MRSVLCVGEVMVELSGLSADGSARVGFGGDTANTAIYLSRLGIGQTNIGYLTRLGDDIFGARIANSLRDEGVELPKNVIVPGRQTGLYAIELSETGERSFSYWRAQSPARDLLTAPIAKSEFTFAETFDTLYFSGISLAIMTKEGRKNLLDLAHRFRAGGGDVMFDFNYRPALWDTVEKLDKVASIYSDFVKTSSIVKAGLDECDAVFSPAKPNKHAAFLRDLGAEIVLVSRDLDGLDIFQAGACQTLVPEAVTNVVDTTAAGDSFNAGFLREYLESGDAFRAVQAGQALAARVVGYSGAIIPKEFMQNTL